MTEEPNLEQDSGKRTFEQSTYVAGGPRKPPAIRIYRRVLVALLGLSVLSGAVLLLSGLGFGHGAVIATGIVGGLLGCLLGGSFLPDREGSGPSDPGSAVDYAIQND